MEMLFSCPRCASALWRPKIGIWEPCRKYGNAIFLSPLHWCPFGVPKSEFGSPAENCRFLNKPANMEMLFSCHLASQNRNLGALPKMVDFLISR